MTRRFFIGVLLCVAFADHARAQHITRYVTDGASSSVRPLADPGEIIIELEAAPLLSRDGKTTSADLDGLLERLERDVASIERRRSVANTDAAPILRHRYTRAFAGASARVSAVAIEQIRQLGYVRSVHPDRVVSALLQESVEQVGAPAVWRDYNARGEGVVVAVIDTGIDYMHPALGGGFGPGWKVRGGRDFVNNDSDPMDDAGHGTHVAGIVAANGDGLTGVAPDATLLAYKVLDQSGSGRDSSVLAAIEEVTRQHPDVVNMSLGRPAATDDPVVRAIENATGAGIIFCVAAGNSGAFLDIGSPGNAPSAITVGAIDREGRLARFSSKGPVVPTGAIKPEIVAPGVGIVSARNGGGRRTASGTSMAAPHVAGVVALLRDAHPDWSVAMLRAAIINGSRPVDAEVMAAGAGSVYAADAVRRTLGLSADTLSFGIADQTTRPWSASRTVTLTNRSDAAQSLTIAVDGARDGIELITSASSISLAPGASESLDFEVRVDPSKVPSPAAGSLSYGGHLRLTGPDGVTSIPWNFVKASTVRVRWSGGEPAHVRLATEQMTVSGGTTRENPLTNLFIGAGDVSLWLRADAPRGTATYHVLRDNIDLTEGGEIAFGPADAPHRVRFAGVDVHGRPLGDRGELSMRDALIIHPRFTAGLLDSLLYLPPDQELFVSALPSSTRLLAFERAFDTEPATTWAAQYPAISGVAGDVELTVAPGAWKSLSARGIVPGGLENPYQSIFATVWISIGRQTIASISRPNVESPPISGDTEISAWMTSSTATDASTGILVDIGDTAGSAAVPFASSELTAEFIAVDEGVIPGHARTRRLSAVPIPSEQRIAVGDGPAFPNALVSGARGTMTASIRWFGPHGEDRICDAKRMQAALYDASGALISSGTAQPPIPGLPLGPGLGFQMFTPLPAPGAYTLTASAGSFQVAGMPARGTLRMSFDSGQSDASPPALTSLRIDPAHAALTFSTIDLGAFGFADINRERTVVHYRPHGAGDDAWQSMRTAVIGEDFSPGFPDGVLYRAEFGTAMSGMLDVRIRVEDSTGNSTEYVIEPARVAAPARRRAVR